MTLIDAFAQRQFHGQLLDDDTSMCYLVYCGILLSISSSHEQEYVSHTFLLSRYLPHTSYLLVKKGDVQRLSVTIVAHWGSI